MGRIYEEREGEPISEHSSDKISDRAGCFPLQNKRRSHILGIYITVTTRFEYKIQVRVLEQEKELINITCDEISNSRIDITVI